MTMSTTGYPYEDYDGSDESFEKLTGDFGPARQELAAQADARRDFTASCERTVAAGQCTGCGAASPELLPWTPRERLCWDCTDLQLDLMALAIGELVTS
jgi:hypothetical protein